MDQSSSSNESAPFRLPEVQPEPRDTGFESSAKGVEENKMAQAVEQNVISTPINTTNASNSQSSLSNPLVISGQPAPIQAVGPTKKIVVTDNLPANDSDLIEKAWVAKAKAIVEQTKSNPYEQTNEFKRMRSDYQTKRFKTNPKIDKE